MNDEEYRKQLVGRTIEIKEVFKLIAIVLVSVLILATCFTGLIISIQNPELTQMQVIFGMLGIGD